MNLQDTRFTSDEYAQLHHWLAHYLPDWSIGYIHGTISASVVCKSDHSFTQLVTHHLLPDLRQSTLAEDLSDKPTQVDASRAQHLLTQLYRSTSHQLNDTEFSYQLVLPHDDEPMPKRLAELVDFCDSFVLAFSTFDHSTTYSQELTHIFDVMGQVQSISPNDSDHLPSDETFENLSEFIRMGVIHLHSERHQTRASND